MDFLNNIMSSETKDWRMIHFKIYDHIQNEPSFCLASLKFYSMDFKKTEEIIFYRKLDNRRSYFSWKIINMDNLEQEQYEYNRKQVDV